MSAERNKTKAYENERDRSLIAMFKAGDRRGLEELYRHYHERVYRSCLHTCRDPEDAIDATQDAFLNVFRRIGRSDGDLSSFRDYLFMSSRNISLKIISKRKRSTPTSEPPEPDELVHASEDPERSALIDDQREILRKATGSLNQRQIDALTMYEIEGKSYSEIGEFLGIEANAVAQLLLRARIRLKKAVRLRAARETSSGSCSDALALLSKKTDGKLHDGDGEWLDAHLDDCHRCRTNLLVMEEVGTNYRSLIPVPAALAFDRVFSDEALAAILKGVGDAAGVAGTTGGGEEAGGAENTVAARQRKSDLKLRKKLRFRKRSNCNGETVGFGRGKKTAVATAAMLLLITAVIAPAHWNGKAERDGVTDSKAMTGMDKGVLASGIGGPAGRFHQSDYSDGSHLAGSDNQGFAKSEKKVLQSTSATAKAYSNLTNDGQIQANETESTGVSEGNSTTVGQKQAVESKPKKKSKPSAKAKKKSCKGVKCKGLGKKKNSGYVPTPTKQFKPAQQSKGSPPAHPAIPNPDTTKKDIGSGSKDQESLEESKPMKINLTMPKLKNNLPKKDCKPLDMSC